MRLPGGLYRDGKRWRDFTFKPPIGAIERALQEAANNGACLPDQVTAALAVSLRQLGGDAPTRENVAGLAIGDRQFLMRRLAVQLALHQSWMTTTCRRCQAAFDYFIDHGRLPVKEAGEGYPFADVKTSLGILRFRVPRGVEQAAIAALEDPPAIFKTLVSRCLIHVPDAEGSMPETLVEAMHDEDFRQIEAALEAAAPEVTTRVRVDCSECGTEHLIDVDPYFVLGRIGTNLDQEIHILASTYHWSEAEILQLSSARRRRYLELIDQSRSMYT